MSLSKVHTFIFTIFILNNISNQTYILLSFFLNERNVSNECFILGKSKPDRNKGKNDGQEDQMKQDQEMLHKKEELKFIYRVWSGYTR